MINKYVIKFFYDEEHTIEIPVKATSPEVISNKITAAHMKKEIWLTFPARDKYSRVLGGERISVNLDKVKYFKVERPTNRYNERFEDEDFVDWNKQP